MIDEKIRIKEYQDKDKDSVYSLILSIMEQEFEDIPLNLYLQDISNIPSIYGGSRDHFYVCEKEGKIIGTVALKEEDEDSVLLRRFFVNPKFRSLGVGSKLINKALEFCRKKKYKKIFFSGNTKMHKVKLLLLKNGFKEEELIFLENVGIFKLSYDLN